jgi:hypothetical protein
MQNEKEKHSRWYLFFNLLSTFTVHDHLQIKQTQEYLPPLEFIMDSTRRLESVVYL